MCPNVDNTISNDPSSNGRLSALPSLQSIPLTFAIDSSSFACVKSSGAMSIPVTFAPALRAVMAVLPNPHAISNTEFMGLTLASLTSLAETGEITFPILL